MSWLAKSLAKFMGNERRDKQRYSGEDLVAYFWTGGHSDPCPLRDISLRGVFLQTDEHWYPGTVVRLVIQHKDVSVEQLAGKDVSGRVITLQAIVVHNDADGVGLAFFFIERKRGEPLNSAAGFGAGRKEMEEFMRPYMLDEKHHLGR